MSSLLDRGCSELQLVAATSVYAIAIAVTFVLVYFIYRHTRFPLETVSYNEQDYAMLMEPISGLYLTKEQLAEYDCNNRDRRYLVALHDVIYDVSDVFEDFGPNGMYAKWSGQELTELIKAEAILKKRNCEQYFQKWYQMLNNCFFIAGEVIAHADPEQEDVWHDSSWSMI